MKKYAIILLVLILIGVGLTVRLLTTDQRLDQTVFLETTESIRNLQALDKNLALLLNESRFNHEFDHAQLSDTNYQISEEFDNLRFDALFEEIEASPSLSETVVLFDEQFASREEELENYIEGNSKISQALSSISSITKDLQTSETANQNQALQTLLSRTNSIVYGLIIGGELDDASLNSEKEGLVDLVSQMQFEAPGEISESLKQYKQAAIDIVANYQPTKDTFSSLNSLKTSEYLDTIEEEYTNYHNQGISGSNQFRNALIGYGICLLGALLFFGVQIRKNFISLEQQVADRTQEIKEAFDNLQESQEQLIQSEKMASLGQMVAGVAHEINTPLGYVTSNIETLKYNLNDIEVVINELGDAYQSAQKPNKDNKEITAKMVKVLKSYQRLEAGELTTESNQLLNDGEYGLSEISKLVVGLKDFARLDRQNTEQVCLHGCVDSSVTIASNHIRENNVTVVKNYSETPEISCFPSKLNQLFLNIITNACQAMGSAGGELEISIEPVLNNIVVSFKDQGTGMDEETQQKMFDPFFTSKEIGKGTGLGMSIAFKIIEAHNGSIDVQSKLGEGTTVSITLPVE